jgi:hypothetical protein
MNGNDMVFVGDSIQAELAATLLTYLDPNKTGCVEGKNLNIYACYGRNFTVNCETFQSPNFTIFVHRNDRLSLTKVFHKKKEMFIEFPWINVVESRNIGVLVLNRGSHYENDTKVISDLHVTMKYLEKYLHGNMTIIWRNTPHGHVTAKNDFLRIPLKSHLYDSEDSIDWPYNWGLFHRQNILIKLWLKTHHPHVIYLDIAHLTSYRSDSHRDGLHYCIPGPIDTWAKMLYYILDMKYILEGKLK